MNSLRAGDTRIPTILSKFQSHQFYTELFLSKAKSKSKEKNLHELFSCLQGFYSFGFCCTDIKLVHVADHVNCRFL